MSGTSPKQLEANWRNAQRSTGPRTPYGCVAAISDRGLPTDDLKSASVPERMLVEKIAVSYWRLRRTLPSSRDTLKIVRYQYAIERLLHRTINQLRSLQEHRGLSHPNPMENSPID